VNDITEEKKEVSKMEELEIVWKDKLTTAEWLSEQSDMIRGQYNTWIKLMPKCMKEGRMSDKQIRLLPVREFLTLLESFLKQYELTSEYNFFGT